MRPTGTPPSAPSALRRAAAFLPAALWAATIWVVSSMSRPTFVPVSAFPLADKGVHFCVFALLGALCAHGLLAWGAAPGSPGRGVAVTLAARRWESPSAARWAAFALGAALAAAWGALDELHQRFVPGREADAVDVLADALGAAAGSAARVMLDAVRGLRRAPAPAEPGDPPA